MSETQAEAQARTLRPTQAQAVVCICVPENRRHTSVAMCFTRQQVATFMRRHGLINEGHARALMAIEEFRPR